MNDQLKEERLSDTDLNRVFDALKANGFEPLFNGQEFVKGKKKVFISAFGFTWQDSRYAEHDLTVYEILQRIKK